MRRDPAKKGQNDSGDKDENEDKENVEPITPTPPPSKKQRCADADCPTPPSDSGM